MAEGDDWKKAPADAVTSLSSSVVASTATGYHDVAKAGAKTVVYITNNIINLPTPQDVDQQMLEGLRSTATEFEQSAERAGVPNTYIFKLKQDRDNELEKSTTLLQKVDTWGHWGMGLGKVIVDWTGALKPSGDNDDS